MIAAIDRRRFLAALSAGAPAALAAGAPGQDREAIEQLIKDFAAAERRYDKAAVAGMLDEDFVYVGNDGSLTRRAEYIRLTDKVLNPLDVLDVTGVEVHVRGNAAIATSFIREKGTIDGKAYEFKGRTLNAFVRRDGKWLFLGLHD